MKFSKVLHIALLLFALLLFSESVEAQCAMCRASAETSIDGQSTNLIGLNRGILYLLGMPYIIASVLIYVVWRTRKANQAKEAEASL